SARIDRHVFAGAVRSLDGNQPVGVGFGVGIGRVGRWWGESRTLLAENAAATVRAGRSAGRGIQSLMSLGAIRQFVDRTLDEWRTIRIADLQYWHRGEGQLVIISAFALIVLLLILRSFLSRRPGRHRLVVPALLGSRRSSPVAASRHLPLALFL